MRTLGLSQSKIDHPFLVDGDNDGPDLRQPPTGIQDDHIAFLQRGVDVLHLIPTPFPAVWHTMNDDAEHLDLPTVEDWARMVTAFVGEWMDLEGYFPLKSDAKTQIGIESSAADAAEL
jgi:hypothetical protein